MPAVMAWSFPGAAWFHHELIPDGTPVPAALTDPRTTMAIWQLGNCNQPPLLAPRRLPAVFADS